MARPKLHLVVWKHLPEKGAPGDLYFVKDGAHQGEMFIAARNGMLCPIPEIFNIIVPEGPQGPAGRDGKDGRDGINGKDGAPGLKGAPGDVSYIKPEETQQAVERVRRKLRDYRARMQAAIADRLDKNSGHPVFALAAVHLRNLAKEAEKE